LCASVLLIGLQVIKNWTKIVSCWTVQDTSA